MDKIIHGDCLKELYKLPDDSVDLMVTDPPYGYSFMGKDWDKAVPSSDIWFECLRVLKPGGFAFVMSAPRSDVQSEMISRLQSAGFRLDFTPIYWTYASGFPKAMNIGKRGGTQGAYGGFQPKPAVEVIIVAMKPLEEKTFVDQALANGKGVTWLDDCRVPTGKDAPAIAIRRPKIAGNSYGSASETVEQIYDPSKGRFPANLLVSDDVLNDGRLTKSSGGAGKNADKFGGGYLPSEGSTVGLGDSGSYSGYFDLDAWANQLPFLIVPKASKREKGVDNKHPTVKPLKLMSYLITLGSRPGDVVLDPFLGSGTTVLAAKQLNRHYVGIEREREYVDIAEARLAAVQPTLLEAAE